MVPFNVSSLSSRLGKRDRFHHYVQPRCQKGGRKTRRTDRGKATYMEEKKTIFFVRAPHFYTREIGGGGTKNELPPLPPLAFSSRFSRPRRVNFKSNLSFSPPPLLPPSVLEIPLTLLPPSPLCIFQLRPPPGSGGRHGQGDFLPHAQSGTRHIP